MFDKIKESKEEIIKGLMTLPEHNHRYTATEDPCATCRARKHFEEAYKRLPSNQTIKTFKERHGI